MTTSSEQHGLTPATDAWKHRRSRSISHLENGAGFLETPSTLSEYEAWVLAEARAILLTIAANRGPTISAPETVRQYLVTMLANQERELFVVVALDSRRRVIKSEILFAGTIDGATVHPREVVKYALRYNAAAVILSHNHPSGVAEPSHADQLITCRLRDALALVDIRVLDHFIVAGAQTLSFSERGLL